MNRLRVVLVRPEIAANVGATARVMRNLGARELVLVAPVADHLAESARQLATHHSTDLLNDARIVGDLDSALGDCLVAAATSARTGGLFRRQTVGPPEEVAVHLVEAMAAGTVAIVFGPESSGLTNEELTRCQHVIHVPTDEQHPALNLAQSVAICLYEIRRRWLLQENKKIGKMASIADQKRMFDRLEESLRLIGYLRGVRGDALMNGLRHLIARAHPSSMEVRLLLGLARQLRWIVDQTRFRSQDHNLPPH